MSKTSVQPAPVGAAKRLLSPTPPATPTREGPSCLPARCWPGGSQLPMRLLRPRRRHPPAAPPLTPAPAAGRQPAPPAGPRAWRRGMRRPPGWRAWRCPPGATGRAAGASGRRLPAAGEGHGWLSSQRQTTSGRPRAPAGRQPTARTRSMAAIACIRRCPVAGLSRSHAGPLRASARSRRSCACWSPARGLASRQA